MTDWGSGASSAPSGGTPWGGISHYSGASVGGGGGGGGGFFGGILNDVEHAAGAVGNFGLDIGRGTYNMGRAAAETYALAQNHPIQTIEHPGSTPFAQQVVIPIARSYAQKYGPVFEHPLSPSAYSKVGHNIAADPIGSALDAATLASLPFTAGESAILRGAGLASRIAPESEFAARLGRAAQSVNESRTLTRTAQLAKGEKPTEYTIARARTPLGIAAQRGYLKVAESPRFADTRVVGASKYVARNFQERLFMKQAGQQALLGKFERSIPLGRAEQAALHIAAQAPRDVARSDWRKVFEDYYQSRANDLNLPKADRADATRMVKIVGGDNPRLAAKIDQVITNPTARWQKFYDAARNVSEQTTKAIGTSAYDAADRASRPADVLAGTHYQFGGSERFTPEDANISARQESARQIMDARTRLNRANAAFRRMARPESSKLDIQITQHEADIQRLREQIGSAESRAYNSETGLRQTPESVFGRKAGAQSLRRDLAQAERNLGRLTRRRSAVRGPEYESALRELQDARDGYRAAQEYGRGVPPPPGSQIIRTDSEFVGPHAGSEGAFSQYAKATEADNPLGDPFIFSHLGPPMPRTNAMGISRTTMPMGQVAKPTIQRFSKMIRFEMGRYMTNPTALTRAGMMGFRWDAANMFQDWLKTHAVDIPEHGVPQGWRRFEPTASKIDRATRERGGMLSEGVTQAEHADILAKHFEDILPKTSTTAHMMVPESLARSVEQEFARNGVWMRRIFDNPVRLWRTAVLKYRPAWLVNNILGQHFLYWLHNASPAGLRSYIQALRMERGDSAARNFVERALRDPAIRSKYKNVLEEQGLHGVTVASTNALLAGDAERYSTTKIGLWREANPKKALAVRSLPRVVTSLGDATTFLNQHLADDWPRIAMYMKLARQSPAALRAQRAMLDTAREMDTSVGLIRRLAGAKTEDILRQVTPEEHMAILTQVNKALGNFNALGALERRYLRRVFPFVAWFKVITTITKDLAVDNPQKLLFLRNLETAANQNPQLKLDFSPTSWLAGSIGLGPQQNGVQSVLTTQSVNPFATDVQLGRAVGQLATGGGQPSDTTGLFGPWYSAAELLLGRDPSTGQAYAGPAAGQPPLLRALLGTLAGLPQYQLYTHRGGSPTQSIYANSGRDYLAQYLGLPIKRVKTGEANQYAAEGR